MKNILVVVFLLLFISAKSQVSTVPEFPTATNSVTLNFDATGTDLENFSGDIYAHTGVIVEGNESWQHVIGSWGNTNQPMLTSLGNNFYKLEITPSIDEFYSISASQTVTKIALVLRSEDGTKQTADIMLDVYSSTLGISFSKPDTTKIYSVGQEIEIQAVSLASTSLKLFINDIEVSQINDNNILYSHTVSETGTVNIKVEATDGVNTQEGNTHFFVRSNSQVAELPSSNLQDGINYIDDNTVTLVLFAPHKDFVFVKGSFNDYSFNTENQMYKTPDGNRYWLTLTNLTAGKEYIYQYFVDGEITIADPYSDKLLDPWNDKYISNATYPNLISYPENELSGIASVFQTAQTPYSWEVVNFDKPQNQDLVIYELHIRDFIASHDYQTLIDTLDYIKRMGINAIELMPVNEFEGNSSWGYNPSFYFAPDKYYGTKDKLKEFIDICHKNGIAVISDIVLNHAFGQSPFVQLYFDPNAGEYGQTTPESPWFNETSPNTDYYWGFDFNHESQETKELVSRITKYWLEEYKFDGFRFDFTKGFTNTVGNGWGYDASRISILKEIADDMWETSPGSYVILEHLTDNSEEKVLANYGIMLWGNLNHSYLEASMGYISDSDFSWISYKKRGWNESNVIGYMESHDEERMMFKTLAYGNSNAEYDIKTEETALKRAELAAAFFFTIPGPKMIWQFGELGYEVSIDEPCRVCDKPIHWEYLQNKNRYNLYKYYSALIKLKTENEVFKTDDFELSVSGRVKEIKLNHSTMNVVIVGNFGVTTETASPDLQSANKWYNYYSQTEYSNDEEFELAAGEYKILTSAKLDLPDVPEQKEDTTSTVISPDINIYPNPVADFITIHELETYNLIQIYDMFGNIVYEKAPVDNSPIYLDFLQAGIYIVKTKKLEKTDYFKIMKL